MLGPIHTPGHQLNGGRVYDVNQAFEPEGELGAMPSTKTRMELLQMFEHRPEQRLGHFRVALSVGVGEGILTGRGRAANRRQRTGVQPQGVAHVIESQGVRQLRIEEADHVAPRTEGATLLLHRMLAGQLGYQVIGNKVAELAEKRELSSRWLALSLFFHALPCGRVQTRKPTLFQPSTIKPVRRQ